MSQTIPTITPNGGVLPLDEIPRLPVQDFREFLIRRVRSGGRVVALFAAPYAVPNRIRDHAWGAAPHENDQARLFAVLADGKPPTLLVASSVVGGEYSSITPECPQVHMFEREIAEQFGITPLGHPWLKPVRFQPPCPGREGLSRHESGGKALPAASSFFSVEGEEVHEVAVGPVHAGIIEPGHFRFQCHGETVFHLEIALGFQHRGVERAVIGGPNNRTPLLMETLAGDTTIGHATAYAQAIEALCGCTPSPRARMIRAIALELERIANHVGDLGALANDIGFLPPAAYFGRLRGDFLNLTAALCGNRFGRGLVRPGGVRFDLEPDRVSSMLGAFRLAMEDVHQVGPLLWKSHLVTDRFNGTGVVSREQAVELGLVGLAARACGLERDVRREFASGFYADAQAPCHTWPTGDVFARAHVRWLEIEQSAQFIENHLQRLSDGATPVPLGALAPSSCAISLVEGWRGEICHVAITDTQSRLSRYKIVDPSFHNWTGLALALRGQQISDFPLCNKSFNLSYCGHDL
ncbi:MAG: NADH-quinone oxidoreductase subunit C [Nitrospirae bacterium]|nr:NADH-quinone oxidoreductase subunit C [Nitrospirota bacterium]